MDIPERGGLSAPDLNVILLSQRLEITEVEEAASSAEQARVLVLFMG